MIGNTKRELDFEKELISYLQNLGGTKQWQYLPEINTTEQLWANFRQILEQNNQKLNKPLSDSEFAQVKNEITRLKTPYEAGQFLYGSNGTCEVEVDMDDGSHTYLTIFDSAHIGAGDTVYQIVNQVKRPAVKAGHGDCIFDTTLLINGLPIIQIEEKNNSLRAKEALNQMHRYTDENQYSDIFSTVQILIGMTETDIRYMAATTADKFNTAFAFRWQREADNSTVRKWKEFANDFLSIPMAHQMATNYMILDGTKNKEMLKVMRPYQVYATKRVLEKVENHHFGIDDPRLGYIWHTTGSGKTISSFKAAWLATRTNVDKVVFIVDRIALTDQTAAQYTAYDPDSTAENRTSIIQETAHIGDLRDKLQSKNKRNIIVTSIQKMNKLAKQYENDKSKFNQKILFIVDEAHRSTGGDGFEAVQKFFKNAAWVGYTGTPMFDKNPSTSYIFGELLHAYTIRDAIEDKNVLGFNVEFQTTLPEELVKKKYLPKYYAAIYPDWTEEEIQKKIESMSPADIDQAVEPDIYDESKQHLQEVVSDVLNHWQNRSSDYKYNALFTTHATGIKPSIPLAMRYYREFKKQNTDQHPKLKRKLKIAITFSWDSTNRDGMLSNNHDLREAMDDYNQMFGTNFDDTTIDEYTADVASHLNRSSGDGQILDLVIVVDRFLTGFDAPKLNTLYVDRELHGANLIQAYSRTNRIENNDTKPFGVIVNYRWPELSKQIMNEALEVYSNRASANTEPNGPGSSVETIVAPPFRKVLFETADEVEELRELTSNFTSVPSNEHKQRRMFDALKKYNRQVYRLKQYSEYDYDHPENLLENIGLTPEQESTLCGGLTAELKDKMTKWTGGTDLIDFDLQVTHISDVKVDYDYLRDLLINLANFVHEKRFDEARATYEDIQRQTKQMDDEQYAKQVNRAAAGIHSGDIKAPSYPVKSTDVDGLIDVSEDNSKKSVIREFTDQWGLDVTASSIEEIISGHQKGQDDLDNQHQLRDLIFKGQQEYKGFAKDPSVESMADMQYRIALRKAFMKFADEMVDKY